VPGITLLFTPAPQADGAGGYRIALMFGRDLPCSACMGNVTSTSRSKQEREWLDNKPVGGELI
jgi:hypothetical protein